jgi:hypothetical protein
MPFKTKLDYSDNRQIKQRQRTFTDLEGGSVFGVPYTALTTGVNPACSAITETNDGIFLSTFSGNGVTTVYTWYDARMEVAASTLSAITNITSGVSQNTGDVFVVSQSGTTADGYDYNIAYTGV